MLAMEAILAVVPEEYREPLGAKATAKEAWAIATMRVGSYRTKKVKAQFLRSTPISSSATERQWRTTPSDCS